ncbi:anti-sigma factor [Geodermatophilus sp. DF01-2]|uniref:anti-sigma factor n=1 Tax=Geodermatophilus sp. DF01-2 TaxID=2559610 RepID=UPI00107489DD|nr:anti-sigma factor [Geodermatophilus sp. DF01_2]TFV59072.1 anti-sigma factor [Geodermatophilus sp. DF01_2]
MSQPREPRRGDHESFDELAVGWALHALEPEDESLFAAHLPTCPRCRRTVAETAEVMGAMASDLPPAAPPDRLRGRLRAAVEDVGQVPPPADGEQRSLRPLPPPVGVPADRQRSADPSPGQGAHRVPSPFGPANPPSSWRRVLPNALVAAGVAAILALGTWNVVLSSAREQAQEAAAARAEVLDELLTPGRATIAPLSDDGTPVATVVAREDQVQVVTQGLRPNDAEAQTYVVWGLDGDDPVALGTFDVASTQTNLIAVGSASTEVDDYGGYGGYAISLEPGGEAPPVPTDVIASGEVAS